MTEERERRMAYCREVLLRIWERWADGDPSQRHFLECRGADPASHEERLLILTLGGVFTAECRQETPVHAGARSGVWLSTSAGPPAWVRCPGARAAARRPYTSGCGPPAWLDTGPDPRQLASVPDQPYARCRTHPG